ncbi:MAG: hypothetical protein FD189_1089 [Elusimicrobia bacterium]|nr:MAG: hypothetical protein FD189_1089 [Elusimicrobiota bacterium]
MATHTEKTYAEAIHAARISYRRRYATAKSAAEERDIAERHPQTLDRIRARYHRAEERVTE